MKKEAVGGWRLAVSQSAIASDGAPLKVTPITAIELNAPS